VLVLAIATLGASAIPAHAQTARGTFTVAHKLLWVGAVLLAGNYAFSLNFQDSPARVTVRQVDGPMVAMLLPQSISDDNFVGSSTLVLHEEGGELAVSMLRLKNIGMALQFASPNWPPQLQRRQGWVRLPILNQPSSTRAEGASNLVAHFRILSSQQCPPRPWVLYGRW
jgi:hypothetical protein